MKYKKVIKKITFVFVSFFSILIVGLIATFFINVLLFTMDSNTSNETINQNIDSTSISNLKITLSNLNINIKESNEFKIETTFDNIKLKKESDTLIIKEKNNSFHPKNESLDIYLDKNQTFEDIFLKTETGNIKVDSLTTNEFNLEIGAGKVNLKNIEVLRKCALSTGTGSVNIINSKLNNLDLATGIGKVKLVSQITGESEIDSGVGRVDITLLGSEEDYYITASKGIGKLLVDGNSLSDGKHFGDGRNKIKITGGVGEININFDSIRKTYTKIYKILSKVAYQEQYKYYVTLQVLQGEVETVIIEDRNNILEVGKNYEFTFLGNSFESIKENFNNKLQNIKELSPN